jgi:hypothetical protein
VLQAVVPLCLLARLQPVHLVLLSFLPAQVARAVSEMLCCLSVMAAMSVALSVSLLVLASAAAM